MSEKSGVVTRKSSGQKVGSTIKGRTDQSIKSMPKKGTVTGHRLDVDVKSTKVKQGHAYVHHYAIKDKARAGATTISTLCDIYSDFSDWSACVARANPADRITLVRRGVASHLLVLASDYFNMPRSAFVTYVGMSSATAERKIKDKTVLGQVESERLERIALIEDAASKVFDDAVMAKEWLLTKNAVLGATPLSVLDTETGAGEVRKILNAISYGGVA